MTYATGSGDYIALMNAVLAFAIADGWTTSGGNWPISKGVVRGVDWSTFTANEADFTLLGGASRTHRYIRISVGTSLANATANAANSATSAVVPNMDRTFTNWYIFSDPGVGKPDYIHVVVQFSNGINPSCWGQFSFGEIDRNGMTHTGIAFASSNPMRAFRNNIETGISSRDWNGGLNGRNIGPFTGSIGIDGTYLYIETLVCIIDPTVSPLPASGWPAVNTLLTRSSFLNMTSNSPGWTNAGYGRPLRLGTANDKDHRFTTMASIARAQPYSGALSMSPIHLAIMNGTTNAARCIFLGTFPGVRMTCVEDYAETDEVTFSTETFKVFPLLRKSPVSDIEGTQVTSGYYGLGYKRVA